MRRVASLSFIILFLGVYFGSWILAFVTLSSFAPGVYFDIELFDVTNGSVERETLKLKRRQDVITCFYFEAVHPGPPDKTALGTGCYRGIPIVRLPYDKIKVVADAWTKSLRERCESCNIDNFAFGMIVTIIVLNSTDREVLYMAHDSIPIQLGELKQPATIFYKLEIAKNQEFTNPRKQILWSPLALFSAETLSDPQSVSPSVAPPPYLKKEVVAKITPEVLRSQNLLPPDYFRESGGMMYIKTPILVVDNKFEQSGILTASISSITKRRVGFSLSLSPPGTSWTR